jgi:hypothetical protein
LHATVLDQIRGGASDENGSCHALPETEHACKPRAIPRCRYALRPRYRWPRSGALFGARSGVLDRRFGWGRRHPQHRLPRAVLYVFWSGRRPPCLLRLLRPEQHLGDVPKLLLARLIGAFRAPGLAGYEWPRRGAYPSRVAVIKTVSKFITNEPP